jgi:multidrug efflux pump subunit AcrA (membrane-fusion protein)
MNTLAANQMEASMKRLSGRTLSRALMILMAGALLAACGGAASPETPSPAPSDSTDFNPIVSATGVVVPEQWARLSVRASGQVVELPVTTGDTVEEGDLLLALDSRPALQAAVTAAELELVSAQQALDQLVETADVARAMAEQELADARDELHTAEYTQSVRAQGNRASAETITAQEGKVLLAKKDLDRAKNRACDGTPDDHDCAQAAINLNNAQLAYDSALRTLNWYTGHPTDIEQAQLDSAVAVAQAKVDDAQRKLDRMQNGPDTRALEAARARLSNAQAALEAAQTQLDGSEVRAPFAGTVTDVQARYAEWVGAGTPVVVIADLSSLRVETTDLNEIDAARVHVGDVAQVTFDAVPDFVGTGTIQRLLPMPSVSGGTNYTTWVQVDSIPASVLWGMTAFVDIEVQE